ncbi:Flp family type IVb pilin [Vibrio furnissii]|uniref:Flp family type IVb pilin n=1 Tax=Vibrio furnissii TaxID=29494 RepID=UPI001EEC6C44|nr:Flp family type IVb pilin [Vibrio furnissii]MCG6232791.1 Flp family type IVb pilin [Vibrio furnissii]MCG6258359.1 Flp family type IVb pilin [Vibrio furnissii]
MDQLINRCKAFWKDEEGLSVVEYVVGAGLLVTALGVIFSGWGTTLQSELNDIFS